MFKVDSNFNVKMFCSLKMTSFGLCYVHIFHISTTKSPFSYCKELYKLVIKVRILSLQQHHKR